MIIEFKEISKGFFKATNIVNNFDAHIHQEMDGQFNASFESTDLKVSKEKIFTNLESAKKWLDRRTEFVLETSFGGA